jgi:hypothetical protein
LALPVTTEGVFVAVVHAVAEKERVPVTEPENVLLPEGEPELDAEPESERLPFRECVPPAAGWPDSVVVRLFVMEEEAEMVGVEEPLLESETPLVGDTLALEQRVKVRDAVGLRETGGLRDADADMEGLLTVGSMVFESVG